MMGAVSEGGGEPSLVRLRTVVGALESGGDLGPLETWAREQGFGVGGGLLGEEGPGGWLEALRLIEPRIKRTANVPEAIRTMVGRLRLAIGAFRRPDGTLALGSLSEAGTSPVRGAVSLATKEEGIVRAAMRDKLAGSSHLVAMAHVLPGSRTDLELHALGRSWLSGIELKAPKPTGEGEAARWMGWQTGPEGDLAEYRFRVGGVEVERLVLWLRRRRLLILADALGGLAEGGVETALELELASGVGVCPMSDGAGLRLGLDDPAFPLRLIAPTVAREGEGRGPELTTKPGRVLLRGKVMGSRAWLPLVVDGDPKREGRVPHWRVVTVTDERRIVGPDEALAFRLGWSGQTESLVVYRSLVPAERRVFLGYQTGARFLVGKFNRKGELTPLIELGASRP